MPQMVDPAFMAYEVADIVRAQGHQDFMLCTDDTEASSLCGMTVVTGPDGELMSLQAHNMQVVFESQPSFSAYRKRNIRFDKGCISQLRNWHKSLSKFNTVFVSSNRAAA